MRTARTVRLRHPGRRRHPTDRFAACCAALDHAGGRHGDRRRLGAPWIRRPTLDACSMGNRPPGAPRRSTRQAGWSPLATGCGPWPCVPSSARWPRLCLRRGVRTQRLRQDHEPDRSQRARRDGPVVLTTAKPQDLEPICTARATRGPVWLIAPAALRPRPGGLGSHRSGARRGVSRPRRRVDGRVLRHDRRPQGPALERPSPQVPQRPTARSPPLRRWRQQLDAVDPGGERARDQVEDILRSAGHETSRRSTPPPGRSTRRAKAQSCSPHSDWLTLLPPRCASGR